MGNIGGLLELVCCIRRATLVSCSGLIGVAPKLLLRRRLNFFIRSGRDASRRPLMLSKGGGRRRRRLHRRVVLGGRSFAWLKNEGRILNTILRDGFRHRPE